MFIRESTKLKKNKKYIQHQLVESIRTPNGPRQKMILNLGILDIPKDKWKELANTIESELHKEMLLFSGDPEIEKLAKHYARIIIREKINKENENINRGHQPPQQEEPQYETVDINSTTTSDCRTLGAEHVVIMTMLDYGFDKILSELEFNNKQIAYAKILVAGRLVHPASERETTIWVNENSAICELLQTDVNIYDNALHRTACLLYKNHEQIEQRLSQNARDLFNLKETIILYDLTNTYFEGTKQNSRLAQPARSKEGRNDRPLVTLALTVDENGFPKQSRILEGNISEPGTLENMLNKLSKENDCFFAEKTIVIDAGIASDKNIEIIKNFVGFKYVAVSRKQSYENGFWDDCVEKEVKTADQNVQLKLKLVKKDGEAFLLCHSEAKEAKEKAILEKKLLNFEKALNKIKNGLTKKGTRKKYATIVERIGRIKERYSVGSLYDINVKEINGIVTQIEYSKSPKGEAKERKTGEYVIRTNRLDLNEEEISIIHRSLTTVENSFRSMKSHLGLRPIHHKRDDATAAHIFVTVIAYHILAGISKKLRANGINYNWETIRNILSKHVRVTTSFKTKDQSTICLRNSTVPTLRQQAIYKSLNLTQQPLKKIKITI